MAEEQKRGPGRPAGEHGPYVQDHMRREKYQITIPQWLIDSIREQAKKEGISAGRLVERLILKDDRK